MFLQSAHSHVFHWRKEPTPSFSKAFHSTRVAFQAPVTIGSGIAECSRPQTNVLNLAPMGAYKYLVSPNLVELHAVSPLSTASRRAMRLSSFFAASRRHRSSIDRTASGEVLPNRLHGSGGSPQAPLHKNRSSFLSINLGKPVGYLRRYVASAGTQNENIFVQ